VRCWPRRTSLGFWNTSSREANKGGIRMMLITAKVQNQADDKTVQPRSNRSVKAADTRLRRKLSKIFHRDSPESGFF
jgi:hypothetical protein